MLIRRYKPGEESALWELFHNTVRHVNQRDYTLAQLAAWAPDRIDPDRWRARIKAIAPFVVEHERQLIAYADVQPNGYLDHFFVHHLWQRRRVGSLLMQIIHEVARQNGVRQLFADVSITARPFFESWGFALETERIMRIQEIELKGFRMVKPLPH